MVTIGNSIANVQVIECWFLLKKNTVFLLSDGTPHPKNNQKLL